ncbi:MAG: hypothetical protein U9N04_03665 [Patescibacteria group bacterium]|nr:hypothetical protein [Patescibacteria group bacterium]
MSILKKYFQKNISRTGSFLLLVFAFSARIADAQCGGDVGIFCNHFTQSPSGIKISTIPEALIVITLYLLSIIGIITLFFTVIAGIKYILSAGNEERMKSAKNAFYYSGTGLAIAVLAYSMLFLIQEILNA